MKVVIVKSYVSKSDNYYDYGDSYSETWHNFNAIEDVREMTFDEANALRRAVAYFNSKKNKSYSLSVLDIVEDEELDSLLLDYKEYERKEALKVEKLERDRKEKELVSKAKSEAKKFDRAVKKYARELNLNEDEVRVMLAKK